MDTGIYLITSPSGKCYVGSAVSFRARWSVHCTNLRAGKHHCAPLQRAFAKYGIEGLRFTKLLVCAREHLIDYEQRIIDGIGMRKLYNVSPTAQSALGVKHSAQSRANMSAAQRGRTFTPEVIQKFRDAVRPKLTQDHKDRISVAHKGRAKTLTECRNISAARNTSGFSYVVFDKSRGTWLARPPQIGGGYKTLGRFQSAAAASMAARQYMEAHGHPRAGL